LNLYFAISTIWPIGGSGPAGTGCQLVYPSPKRFGSFSLVRRDTPISISLPRPLCVTLENAYVQGVGTLSSTAKIYEDGAITIILRTKGQLSIDDLGPLSRDMVVSTEGGKLSMEAYGTQLFYRVLGLIDFAIVDPVPRERRGAGILHLLFVFWTAPKSLLLCGVPTGKKLPPF